MRSLLLPPILAVAAQAAGLTLTTSDQASILSTSATLARSVMSYYVNNATGTSAELVGTFPFPPYYWWESGAAWGGMIDYWAYTKDTSYVDTTVQAIVANAGNATDFMLPWHVFDTGNDDQGFWALGVMSAVEMQFPSPPAGQPQYLDLAINTFNSQIARWDTAACGGGLRWQIFEQNAGYDYKNAISNGALLQLAARLARYTGEQVYQDWAEKVWEWSQAVGLIGAEYEVYDGTSRTNNCSDANHIQWTYNNAIYLYGAAAMANLTASQTWVDRVNNLLKHTPTFFSPFTNSTGVMYEAACETVHTCNTDQFSFKAYLSRWMAKTAILAPWTKDTIYNLLTPSAVAAVGSCLADSKVGAVCGSHWYYGAYDGVTGLGQQLSAFETVNSLIAANGGAPVVKSGVKIPCYAGTGTCAVAASSLAATAAAAVSTVVSPVAASAPANSVVSQATITAATSATTQKTTTTTTSSTSTASSGALAIPAQSGADTSVQGSGASSNGVALSAQMQQVAQWMAAWLVGLSQSHG